MNQITINMLNKNQQKAVKWKNGSLIVLAGPGSGKTTVLTLRITHLITKSSEEKFRILGLTFTVKAANEMQERINNILGETNKRVQIRTFHSFCTDLLRQHGSHLGLKPDFEVITDDKDRIAIIKSVGKNNGIDVTNPEDILKKINIMFSRGITPENLSKYYKPKTEEQFEYLKSMYECYLAGLINNNQLDFGSMLHFSQKLLQTVSRVEKQVRTVYKYICVDEFQDTNLAQYKLLKLISPPESKNLFVVADDDQIIFQWNGADPKRLEDLKKDYDAHTIQLPENYRCPKEIVDIANKLILYNYDKKTDKMPGVSVNKSKGSIKLKSFDDFETDEIDWIVKKIGKIPKREREKCIVIARTNKLLTHARQALLDKDINAEVVSKHQDFTSPLVLLIYLSLKLSNNPNSRSILNKLCSVASGINGITVSAEEVVSQASVQDTTISYTFFSLLQTSELLKPFSLFAIETIVNQMKFQEFVIKSFEYFDSINSTEDGDLFPDYNDDKTNWQRISRVIIQEYGEQVPLHTFLQQMDLTPKSKELSSDCVRLQTVHTAKGMEFENVFLIGMVEDQFPTYFAIKNGIKSIQEERRNCFVAVTRSTESLYITYSKKYFGWSKKPSRFLKEMGLLVE